MINEVTLVQPDTTKIPGSIKQLLDTIGDLTVTDEDGARKAKQALDSIKLYQDTLAQRKQEYIGGAKKYVQDVEHLFKFLQEPLDKKQAEIRKKVEEWKDKVDAEVAEQVRLAKEAGLAPVEAPVNVIRTEGGSLSFRQVLELEIKDKAQIPEEYKIINESKLKADIKEGKMPQESPAYRSYLRNSSVNRS